MNVRDGNVTELGKKNTERATQSEHHFSKGPGGGSICSLSSSVFACEANKP